MHVEKAGAVQAAPAVRIPEPGLCWPIPRHPTTAIERALDELGPLPVLSGTVASVRSLASDPETSNEEIVAAIEQDEAFAANVLRVANSASFARRYPATTLRHAIAILGRNELQRLALAARTYQFLQQVPGNGRIARGQMHVHALTVASYAEAVAHRCGASVDTAHLAGLLHDVGKLVLPLAFGENESDSIALEFPNGSRRAAAERDRLGVDHAYAGALLAGRSNASDDVFQAITFSHGGRSGQESPTPEAACVQIGNCLVNMLAGFEPDLELLHVATERVGLPATVLDEVAEEVAGASVRGVLDPLVKRVRTLERLAQTDALTGLANRRHWLEQVNAALAAAPSGAVVICDLDHFKQINDGHGHETGDQVLIQFAELLPEYGLAGRLGGDEFAIWIEGDVAVAETAAARLIDVVQSTFDEVYELGLSLGIAPAPECGETPIDLLRAADYALYAAKAAGRGRAHVASGQ